MNFSDNYTERKAIDLIEVILIDAKIPYEMKEKCLICLDKMKMERWRAYHSVSYHILPMCQEIKNAAYLAIEDSQILFYAAVYHDCVYNPKSKTNEKDSAEYWLQDAKNVLDVSERIVQKVYDIILETKEHNPDSSDYLTYDFCKLDLLSFSLGFQKMLEDEKRIRHEYQFAPWNDYVAGRCKVLKELKNNQIIYHEFGFKALKDIDYQIEYLKFTTPNIAIYLGSFNPFHIGHLDILHKAERIFDKVIIVYADNPDKDYSERKIPECLDTYQIEMVKGSIVEWIQNLDYPVTIVRGLRNATDLSYEQNYLYWLNELSDAPIKFVSIFCDKEHEHISSSALKALGKVNADRVQNYLP
jgi:pantetheine-phosphate adenylyltransferase